MFVCEEEPKKERNRVFASDLRGENAESCKENGVLLGE